MNANSEFGANFNNSCPSFNYVSTRLFLLQLKSDKFASCLLCLSPNLTSDKTSEVFVTLSDQGKGSPCLGEDRRVLCSSARPHKVCLVLPLGPHKASLFSMHRQVLSCLGGLASTPLAEHPHLLPVGSKRGIRSKDPITERSGVPDGDQGLDMAAQGLKHTPGRKLLEQEFN